MLKARNLKPLFTSNSTTCTLYIYLFLISPIAEVEPEVGVEMFMVTVLKEASDDLVFKVAAYGNSKLLGDILKKFPEKVNTCIRYHFYYLVIWESAGEYDVPRENSAS